MADPMTPAQLAGALRAEGVRVVEHPGWETHNRNSKGPFGPVHGVVIHHTVSSGAAATVRICNDGYTGLPGPLCHGVITKDGTVHLISAGRANHAGGGDPDTLSAVKDESYDVRPPLPDVGNSDGVDGNRSFYGFECENLGDGKDPWPDAQLDAIERASAAICRHYGWRAKSVIGHLEWSDDKNDPRGFTMPDMRARVERRLAKDPGGTPEPPKETPVALTDKDIDRIVQGVLGYNGSLPNGKTDPMDVYAYIRTNAADTAALKPKLGSIDTKVGQLQTTVLTDAQLDAIVNRLSGPVAERVADLLAARLAK